MRGRHGDGNYGKPLYVEVIRWPNWLWTFILFMDFSLIFAIWAALSITSTAIATLIIFILTFTAFNKSQLRITVTQGWLLVGPAAIERAFIYNFESLDKSQMRNARGIESSPLDYFQIRFWVPGGLSLQLRDPRDKTIAWKVSTNNGDELSKVLGNPVH